MNYSKGSYVRLKTWEQLLENPHAELFINDEYYSTEEIKIRRFVANNLFINAEYKTILGQVAFIKDSHYIAKDGNVYFTNLEGGWTLWDELIDRQANSIDEPEYFL